MGGPTFDAIQVAGAVLVLACFLLAQADRIDPTGYRYLIANLARSATMAVTAVMMQFRRTTAHSWLYLSWNLAGSRILTWLAITEAQWGFVLLQGVWALAALTGVVRRAAHGSSGVG